SRNRVGHLARGCDWLGVAGGQDHLGAMVGGFGLLEGPQARRAEFPRDRLVDVRGERGQQLDAWQVECATVVDPSCRPTRDANLWRCPGCGRHTRFLYTPEVECRTCLRLEYQSQHRNHALPDIPRLKRLRRLIGASAEFFTPLPRMPCKLSPQQRAR